MHVYIWNNNDVSTPGRKSDLWPIGTCATTAQL